MGFLRKSYDFDGNLLILKMMDFVKHLLGFGNMFDLVEISCFWKILNLGGNFGFWVSDFWFCGGIEIP